MKVWSEDGTDDLTQVSTVGEMFEDLVLPENSPTGKAVQDLFFCL